MTNWNFQQEWRYLINCVPIGIKEISTIEQSEIIKRIEDTEYRAPFDKIFLKIDEEAFEDKEVLIGDKASEGDEIIVKALLNQYSPNSILKESKLKIR